MELSDAIAERNDIHAQLINMERARSALESEMETINQTLVERNKLIEQLNQDKEVLTKDNAEMEVISHKYFVILVIFHVHNIVVLFMFHYLLQFSYVIYIYSYYNVSMFDPYTLSLVSASRSFNRKYCI